jgi:hypothetical protein
MACWSHQSWNAEAVRCCQTKGLTERGYSFTTTEITPVSITYAFELTNFSSAWGSQTCPDRSRLRPSWLVQGLQHSLSAA